MTSPGPGTLRLVGQAPGVAINPRRTTLNRGLGVPGGYHAYTVFTREFSGSTNAVRTGNRGLGFAGPSFDTVDFTRSPSGGGTGYQQKTIALTGVVAGTVDPFDDITVALELFTPLQGDFSPGQETVPPTYGDVDAVRVQNRGTVGRNQVYDGSGLELRVRCVDSDGAIVLPETLEWRLLDNNGNALTSWASLTPTVTYDEFGEYSDVYADIEIDGDYNQPSRLSERRHVVITSDRGESNEYTEQWTYTVRMTG